MILTIDEVNDLLDEMAEEFPEVFFRDLNGGISLIEEIKTDTDVTGLETCILGEYCTDGFLGRYINLYYGSFLALAQEENWSVEDWEDELYTTLAHELTHHVEGLAGERGLEIKDAEELARWRAEWGSAEGE